MPSGPERSDEDTANKCEALPPLSAGPHGNDCIPLLPPTPLPLFTILRLVFDWGSTDQFYHHFAPPRPLLIVPPEVFMGRPTGCSTHQEIKAPSLSKCALARCDLFNLNRVNITYACKTGITVAEQGGCGHDNGSFSCNTRAHFSIVDDNI